MAGKQAPRSPPAPTARRRQAATSDAGNVTLGMVAAGSNLNHVNTTNSTPPSYPTFINIGPISFIN